MIREYQEQDRDTVMEVWDAASAVAHPFLDESFVAQTRQQIRDEFLPITRTWVWESDGQVIGFVSIYGNEIGGLFVSPTQHRRAIGRALVEFAKQQAGPLEVEVFAGNTIGRSFYAKQGFVETAQKLHDPTGQSLIRLGLPSETEKSNQ